MWHRKFWPVVLMLLGPVVCLASVNSQPGPILGREPFAERERQGSAGAMYQSGYRLLPNVAAQMACEATQVPEALATPSPLLDEAGSTAKVTVSFIIGVDGQVHSPFILRSSGSLEEPAVLATVRSWRYRPAKCNGVPTETESKVEFSAR